MRTTGTNAASAENDEAIRAWDGPLYERFVRFREVKALGPAGEILRLAGERAVPLHREVDAALREGLSEFVLADGSVRAPASTWIVAALAPRD